MALMDIADIRPLASALFRLLKPGGRFVFTVPHPCFNTASVKRAAEEEDRDGDLRTVHYVKVSEYLTPSAGPVIGIPGQPVPHLYFDRPISLLLKTFFDVGFVIGRVGGARSSRRASAMASGPALLVELPRDSFGAGRPDDTD